LATYSNFLKLVTPILAALHQNTLLAIIGAVMGEAMYPRRQDEKDEDELWKHGFLVT